MAQSPKPTKRRHELATLRRAAQAVLPATAPKGGGASRQRLALPGSSGVQEFRSSGVQEYRSRQENPECEEEHVIGKKTRLGNTIQGPSGEDSPTRQRLATDRKRTLRSRQRWRHEAYGAVPKPCD